MITGEQMRSGDVMFNVIDIFGKKCLYSKLAGMFEWLLSNQCDSCRGIGPDIVYRRDKTFYIYNMARDEGERIYLARTCRLILDPTMFYGSVLSKDILIPDGQIVHYLPTPEWDLAEEKMTVREFVGS